jgi:hypothetical protein
MCQDDYRRFNMNDLEARRCPKVADACNYSTKNEIIAELTKVVSII